MRSPSWPGSCSRPARPLVLLLTSRQPLGTAEETVVSVGPLPVPENGHPLGAVTGHESVQLFVDRARAALGAFDLSSTSQDAVVETVGNWMASPLALELVAVRLRALSPEQPSRRLEHDSKLLNRRGGVHDRSHAMWSSIECSYNSVRSRAWSPKGRATRRSRAHCPSR